MQPSPLWLQYRLTAIGLNPINNIVDMTNFVMAELAQPMHAFDADLLQGGTIFVRPAQAGRAVPRAERRERTRSTPSNLVIADAAGAIAMAGVIGGGDSAISDEDHARRAGEREFPGVVDPQDVVRASSCAPTRPCASKRRRIR